MFIIIFIFLVMIRQGFLDFFYDLAHGDVEDGVRAYCYYFDLWSYFFLDRLMVKFRTGFVLSVPKVIF